MGKAIDLTGQKFGKLTVIKRSGTHITPSGQHKPLWLCKCDCGNEVFVTSGDLKNGHTKSCGCLSKNRQKGFGLIDLTGKRFGKLTVIERTNDYVYKNATSPLWLCQCDCGNIKAVQGGNLRNGVVTHCGCNKQSSKEEAKVAKFLTDNHIVYMREYYFNDLIGKTGDR